MTDSQVQEILTRLEAYLPDGYNEDELTQIIKDAGDWVLAYTCRTEIPDVLIKSVADVALVAWNRRGTEGESSRSEGGESYQFEEVPKHITEILNRYRLAKIGGKSYEVTSNEG